MAQAKPSSVWPINENGEVVASVGTGTSTVVGFLGQDNIPLDSTNKFAVVGLSGGSSIPAPVAITTSRNLLSADNGGTLYNATANAYTLTVPSGLTTGFGVAITQNSTGVVTIAAGSGVTVNNISSFTKTAGQWAVISVIQTAPNTYILVGTGAV